MEQRLSFIALPAKINFSFSFQQTLSQVFFSITLLSRQASDIGIEWLSAFFLFVFSDSSVPPGFFTGNILLSILDSNFSVSVLSSRGKALLYFSFSAFQMKELYCLETEKLCFQGLLISTDKIISAIFYPSHIVELN